MSATAFRSRVTRRAAACRILAFAVGGASVAVACSGPVDPPATTDVITDTLEAWAVNGTEASEPTGYYLAENRVVPTTSAGTFDFAFDVDSARGQAVIIPVRILTDGSIAGLNVGLQHITTTFDSTTFAFRSGYVFDSIYHLSPGQGMMMVSNPPGCATDPNPSLYGKFVIDSVNVVQRTIHFRATEDPNCGYRDLVPNQLPAF